MGFVLLGIVAFLQQLVVGGHYDSNADKAICCDRHKSQYDAHRYDIHEIGCIHDYGHEEGKDREDADHGAD